MEFIFMLTRADQTVEDCLEVFDRIKDEGLRHVGFKDVGADRETLKELNRPSAGRRRCRPRPAPRSGRPNLGRVF